MNKELLKFFTYFTDISRIRTCIRDRTRRIILNRRYPSNSNEISLVGKLYISEGNAYIVLSPWHVLGFEKLIKPYVSCTKVLTTDMDDEVTTIYHITGMRNKDYVSDFK